MHFLQNLNIDSNKIIESIPEIVYIGNPVLRTVTQEVDLEEGNIIAEKLMQVLKKYREITGIGRGLAAPQIGMSKSVVVTFVDNKFTAYFNPRIVTSSESKKIYKENCLSSSHIWCDVVRPETVTVEYMNNLGEKVVQEYSGFVARLLQHEIDHLQGIVNIDKAEKGTIDYKNGDPLEEKLRNVED